MDKLTSEEIAKRRAEFEELSDKRGRIIERLMAAKNSGEDCSAIIEKFAALDRDMCEHGRHWSSDCRACDDIHKQVFPEHYKQCASCLELFELEYIDVYDMCDECGDRLECLIKKSS